MYNITVCIPTYKRPLMLEELIISISKCRLDKPLIKTINIIIVDNDIDRSAEKIIDKSREQFYKVFEIHYYNFPSKGLSNVRNELIKNALLLKPDFIVFVDDDEFVTQEWLNELVKTIILNNGDMVSGPVISVFNTKASKYISCWFDRLAHKNNEKLTSIASGNLIINVTSLLKNKIWFDERFNKTGSEDSYFGMQMMEKGATAYWANNAIAYENISKSRANLKWLIQRWFRGSITYTYMLSLEKKYYKIAGKILTNLVYIFVGICALIIIPFPIKRKYWGILKATEGFGGLVGLFNIMYEEYK